MPPYSDHRKKMCNAAELSVGWVHILKNPNFYFIKNILVFFFMFIKEESASYDYSNFGFLWFNLIPFSSLFRPILFLSPKTCHLFLYLNWTSLAFGPPFVFRLFLPAPPYLLLSPP